MIITLPPVGAVAGAVYTVAAPLAVVGGLNVPQAPAGVQLQFTTGELDVSFATVAVILAVPEIGKVVGGLPTKDTVIGKVTVAATDFVPSATEVAVIVTLPPLGAVMGAV
ncbi:MAG: hypothetical protein WBL63_18875 [Candidatus Acidiferrum sp.]